MSRLFPTGPRAAGEPGGFLAARLGGVPLVVAAAIAAAWTLALVAEASGNAALLRHDALIEGGPAGPAAAGLFLVSWQAMIAAMMLPSSLPLVRLFARASSGQPHPQRAMGAFLGAYALVWTAFGAVAFAGDVAFHELVERTAALESAAWVIPPAVLALAGAFQFTSLKDRCLEQCRHPGAFILRFYERGTGGAFRLGARHGLFCLGCCWALMLVAFAVGVASLAWMGVLTALMVHEKTRPGGRRDVPVTGVILLGAAALVLVGSAV